MAKSAVQIAVDSIDADIRDLERAKQILLNVQAPDEPVAPKVRKPRKKRGLPESAALPADGLKGF